MEIDEDDEDDPRYYKNIQNSMSIYAPSIHPGAQSSHQGTPSSENGHDGATIDSSRTLYAEDIDYVTEHGRQYCGEYYMPVDQTEQTRQYVLHQVFLKVFDLELTTVPLDHPEYILDIGTGIGEWAIGMAERYPEAEVFGTDIAPIQPTQQVPFNVEFHIENAEDEWIRPQNAVDLVHIRNMEGCFSDWPFIYGQAFDCIKPGGWIEVIDWEDFTADGNFLGMFPQGSPAHILTAAIREAAEVVGRPVAGFHLNRQMLLDVGFVDIYERVYDMRIGSREDSRYGKLWLFCFVTGLEAFCLRPLTKYLGMDADYVRQLCDTMARETRIIAEDPNRVEPFHVKLRVMTGRKSHMAGQWTARAVNENADMSEYSGDESTIGGKSIRTTVRMDDPTTSSNSLPRSG
ncbi:S-adenosyl-L-methionine-dependent methyltransferase [Cladorrhinum sp. PSN259]|nr:S-adenosyl-L-methionine-dependent methyltransferase [Cladorrhinum sp. PSN259]